MTTAKTNIETFIGKFHAAAKARDIGAIGELFAESVVFHTPRFLRPITERSHLLMVLKGIIDHVEGFDYYRIFVNGNEAVMEFKGQMNGVVVHGVDIFTLDESGKAKELTVMIRPNKALAAIGEMEDKFLQGMGGQVKAG